MILHRFRRYSLAAAIALFFLCSCGDARRAAPHPSAPTPSPPPTEFSGSRIRVLIADADAPRGLGRRSEAAAYLSVMASTVARGLGLDADIVVGRFDGSHVADAFVSSDLIVGFIPAADGLADAALLVPFFPLPGRLPEGPAVSYWLCPPGAPKLAMEVAKALSAGREGGSFSNSVDAVLGEGSSERYYAAIGYDGILRAQYLPLGPEERAWVDARRAAGGALRAAVRHGGVYAYVPQPDGSVKGFDFDLVVALAASLGLRLDLSTPKDVGSFFTRDGIVPPDLGTRDYNYTPDLLKKVDLYANPMGVTPWRQRLMKMITIYPVRNLLAGRKGEELSSIAKLNGKRFAVIKDSVQQSTLQDFAEKNGVSLRFVYAASEDELFELVRERRADYILDGSVIFALRSDELRDFGLSPFFSDLQGVAWAVKKDDTVFAAILQDFFNASRDSGLLPALWTKTFKMDFTAYIGAITAAAEVGSN